MKISFENKHSDKSHLIIICFNNTKIISSKYLNNEEKSLINNYFKINDGKGELIDTLHTLTAEKVLNQFPLQNLSLIRKNLKIGN